MARTALTVHQIVRTGLVDPAATTGTADGHMITNDGAIFLEFTNAVASARSVTIQTPATLMGKAVEDEVLIIPASALRHKCGPFEIALFNRPRGGSDPGTFYLDYPTGQHADLSVRAFAL